MGDAPSETPETGKTVDRWTVDSLLIIEQLSTKMPCFRFSGPGAFGWPFRWRPGVQSSLEGALSTSTPPSDRRNNGRKGLDFVRIVGQTDDRNLKFCDVMADGRAVFGLDHGSCFFRARPDCKPGLGFPRCSDEPQQFAK